MKIAIDFDDTIHDRSNIKPGYQMGTPIPGSREAVQALVDQGVEVYILTASTNARMRSIKEWLAYFKFPEMHVTDTKHKADYYIDDRAIRFDNWAHVMEQIDGTNS